MRKSGPTGSGPQAPGRIHYQVWDSSSFQHLQRCRKSRSAWDSRGSRAPGGIPSLVPERLNGRHLPWRVHKLVLISRIGGTLGAGWKENLCRKPLSCVIRLLTWILHEGCNRKYPEELYMCCWSSGVWERCGNNQAGDTTDEFRIFIII